jgi:hypothetical protein
MSSHTSLCTRCSSVAAVVILLTCPELVRAQAPDLCAPGEAQLRKGGWIVDVSYRPSDGAAAGTVGYVTTSISHTATASGFVDLVTGRAQVRDGTSNTVFFAEQYRAFVSCGDVNLDGIAGITVLQFSLRDARTGAIVPVSVIPRDGELDRPGEEAVTIVIGGLALTGSASVRDWVFGTELPG